MVQWEMCIQQRWLQQAVKGAHHGLTATQTSKFFAAVHVVLHRALCTTQAQT